MSLPRHPHPAGQLVVHGLYWHVRNPMYLAVLAVITGQATITEAGGSHVIMVSQPQVVADVIMTAAAAVHPPTAAGGPQQPS